jgi:hypothetical protein
VSTGACARVRGYFFTGTSSSETSVRPHFLAPAIFSTTTDASVLGA